jgi:hypothetical protein
MRALEERRRRWQRKRDLVLSARKLCLPLLALRLFVDRAPLISFDNDDGRGGEQGRLRQASSATKPPAVPPRGKAGGASSKAR